MPLTGKTPSLASGFPLMTRSAGSLRVAQGRGVGWVLLSIALSVPGAILVDEMFRDSVKPFVTRFELIRQMDFLALAGMAFFLLFFGALFVYGLFWVLWKREFTVDLAAGRYRFVTGVLLWQQQCAGQCSDVLTMHLARKRISGDTPGVPYGMSGSLLESWELRLAIPGCREPFFLGEWGDHDEALAEGAAWREIFDHLVIEDERSLG